MTRAYMGAYQFARDARRRERSEGLTWRVVRQSRGQRRHGGGLPAAGGGGGRHRKGCWLTSDFRNEHLWRPAGDAAAVGAAVRRRRCAEDEDLRLLLSRFASLQTWVALCYLHHPHYLGDVSERGCSTSNAFLQLSQTFSGRP